MADFYTEMATMAHELLAPTSSGGLGQGVITLARIAAGADPNDPWGEPKKEIELVYGAAKGISSKLIGTEYGSTVLLASDKEVITTVPVGDYTATDAMVIDEKEYNIIGVQPIPAAGIASAYKFIVRA